MILLIAIILFIIFLIYSIKPRSEEYILEGLKLSWKNKMGIEGVVDKWIVILKDKSGTTIHEYENSDAGNLKNYTDVTMNIVDNKEFDDRIIGDNTLELYYNDIKPDTKLYTKPLTFTENDFGYIIDMSKLEEIDIPKPGSESKSGTAYTYSPGFEWGYYNDRYNDDDDGYSGQQTWFDTRKPVHTHNTSDRSRVTDFRNINTASSGQTLVNGDETYSYLWTGYFKAPSTGTYYFNTTSDDNSHMWIGPNALNPRYDNVTVNNGGLHGMQTATSAGVSLTGGEYYDFRMTFGERGSGDNLQAQWRLSTGSFTYDWSKVAFSNRQILEEFDAPETESYTYEFIINKLTAVLGLHVEYIKLDGVLATKAQTTIHKSPNRNNKPDNMFSIGSGTENYASWNSNGYSVGDKIFTIKSDKKVDKIDIVYMRPRYAPGWIIKENGVTKITETSNRGRNMDPRPVVYTYDIKNGKLYYGGDSNLGRDGRDACSMTDDDKKYACNNDSELVGIGSGPTCGHKYYITDKGQGHISSPNERYYKFYSCAKKDYNKLYYGGDSNLGRDGRNACNMTDDDKKYACDNDSELVGIGSGTTCGHKYYITDKGQGHISSTDERYSKFYSCAKNGYI